ncbi:hypothetical protein [Sphingomonas leidyi]|uniref:hypothetical protein n=1 Tax=Sphingomonas leidyi TaxID=68569 RepID=UPI00142096E3|nr:hypothetical protein [Sphingomonas leidyi]
MQLTNRDGTSSSSYSYDRDGALTGVAINGGTRPASGEKMVDALGLEPRTR